MNIRTSYYIQRKSLWAVLSVLFMVLSFALRSWWAAQAAPEGYAFAVHVCLPLASNVLFAACVLIWGEKALWTSFFPALMGVLFFILKALGFPSPVQTVLCVLLYLLVAALFGLTVFGFIPTKKPLIPLFALPLAYHIIVQDLIQNRETYTLHNWLQELSVLCVMAALLCLSIGMRQREKAKTE